MSLLRASAEREFADKQAAIEVQKWTEGLVNEVPQKDFIEISAFVHPPKAVAYLLEAVLILCGVEPKWNTDVFPHEPNYWVVAQYHLRDPKRIQKKMTEVFVDGRVPRERMDIAARYLLLPEFQVIATCLLLSAFPVLLVLPLPLISIYFPIVLTA